MDPACPAPPGGAARDVVRLDLSVARRIETAEAVAAAAYAANHLRTIPASQAASVRLDPDPAWAVYISPGSPVNRAIGLGIAGLATPEQLELVEAFYRRRGAAVPVDCCPLADQSLFRLLARRGYVLAGFKQVMATQLISAHLPPLAPTGHGGIKVDVAAPGEVDLWTDVVARGFGGNDAGELERSRSIARPSFGQDGAICLLGWVDGQPSGGGVVDLRDGVAFLRSQSTVAESRRRGLQAAIIQHSLALAVHAGCDLAVVQASPGSGSQRNLERAGFRTLYTKPTLARTAS